MTHPYPARTFAPKDPSAVLDYRIDWSAWLAGGDSIMTSSWAVPPGITKDSESHTATTTTIMLSGGTVGQNYDITNTITTAAGLTDCRTLRIPVADR